MKYFFIVLQIIISISITGCKDSDKPEQSLASIEAELQNIITELGLTGDPSTGKTLTSINDPLPQLGMKLFFSKGLGGDKDAACVSCHHPMLGGGDALSLPIGSNAVEPDLLGPGRIHRPDVANYDGGPTVARNSPTTFNVALYDKGLFWDSRVEKIAGGGIFTPSSLSYPAADPKAVDLVSAQARFPVTSKTEMRGLAFEVGYPMVEVWSHLESRIGDYSTSAGELAVNNWKTEFETVYGIAATVEELITFDRIVEAIGAYERSQIFINNPWKSYVAGDTSALSISAKKGALLFFKTRQEGGAGCAECHSGDFFTNEQFHTVAMPQIGRGKGVGPTLDNDAGRFMITMDEVDKFAFRTPSLLNVEVTGPWGHAGAYTTLEQVIRHYIDPVSALINYDYNQLDNGIQISNTAANTQYALDKVAQDKQDGRLTIQNVVLTNEQVIDLLSFLESLTDPCVKDRNCLAPWIPDHAISNPDILRINAYDKNGKML